MEYQPLDVEFTSDNTINSDELDIETLLQGAINADDEMWLKAVTADTQAQAAEVPRIIEYEAPSYDTLTVLPPETWSDDYLYSYIKPDPDTADTVPYANTVTPTRAPPKREARKPTRKAAAPRKTRSVKQEVDQKYQRRLEANKLSAQASRERKKQLKNILEDQMTQLEEENTSLSNEITQLETENKVLKGEFVQLQSLIAQSPVLSKLMAQQISMNLPTIEEMENMKIERQLETQTVPLFTPSASTDPAAFMYLMIVLQTFSQYFANTATSNMSVPMSGLTFPMPVM